MNTTINGSSADKLKRTLGRIKTLKTAIESSSGERKRSLQDELTRRVGEVQKQQDLLAEIIKEATE